jgi:hypothetical protein
MITSVLEIKKKMENVKIQRKIRQVSNAQQQHRQQQYQSSQLLISENSNHLESGLLSKKGRFKMLIK